VDRPATETSPTLEQELESLRPPRVEGEADTDDQDVEISFTYKELSGLGVSLGQDDSVSPKGDADISEESPDESEDEDGPRSEEGQLPAFTESQAPYVVTRLSPTRLEQTYAEPSYIEDPTERQLYRVRTVATAVGVVVMLLLLMYALGKGIETFGEWWDSFFGQLRL
jgi:hypothetical protein